VRRVVTSRSFLVIVLVAAASAVAVFVGSELDREQTPAEERVRPDGSLAVDPKPLSLDDLRALESGSPAEAVIELWYWAQWGSLPNVVAAYDPVVVDRLGAGDIASAYSMQRQSLIASKPRILEEVRGREGTAVSVEALRRNASPTRYSFTLRESDGEWLVVFDTLLESGIAAWAQFDAMPDPDAGTTPASARRAGIRAAHRYRDVALDELETPE
jgi:hypothetical protein